METQSINYSSCPVCGGTALSKALVATDYLVSEKEFEIWECGQCTLRFTQQAPDEQSIAGYYKSGNYISHSDTRKGLINYLYHLVRNLTLADKRRLIRSVSQRDKGQLLDIGAGAGAFAHYMQKSGWQVKGLEPDEEARKNAASLYQLELLTPDAFFQFPENSFDIITMWHVLEHVHDLHAYMAQLRKLLKPNGKILIAVPNYTSFDGGFYKRFWAAYDVPRHLYHFSPEAMYQLLDLHQLPFHTARGMFYDSFYISMLSEKYKKGNIVRSIFVALLSNLKAFVDKEKFSSLIYIAGK